jgi:hypothetical protein
MLLSDEPDPEIHEGKIVSVAYVYGVGAATWPSG